MPINRLISIIDEQSMLRFFVIIDFINYQFLSTIKANRSVNWHWLSSIGFHFWSVLFSVKISKNTVSLCMQTIRWTNSNLKHLCVLRVRIRTCCTCWNVWDTEIFLKPIDGNRWVATTFVWLSIGHRLADANRCQLTNKASIVIDWSIDFPIIGFIDCSSPDVGVLSIKVFVKIVDFVFVNGCKSVVDVQIARVVVAGARSSMFCMVQTIYELTEW